MFALDEQSKNLSSGQLVMSRECLDSCPLLLAEADVEHLLSHRISMHDGAFRMYDVLQSPNVYTTSYDVVQVESN